MKILVDTHAFIWFAENNPSLSVTAKTELENPENEIFISIASLWEMSIKISIKKLQLKMPIFSLIESLSENGVNILSISPEHVIKVSDLEFHHRDPFDRLIIAQGMVEKMSIITADDYFQKYDVDCLW